MRRTIRTTGPRLLSLLLAAVLAAPVAAATPAAKSPAGASGSLAPAASSPSFRKSSRELRGGERVVAAEVAARGAKAQLPRALPLLSWEPTGGGTPQSNQPLLAAEPPSFATTTTRPPIATPTFDGLASAGAEPPDPWLAVGPDHIVQVVNVAMRITDRQGQPLLDMSLAQFFEVPAVPATHPTDPRVIFDNLHRRWFAAEMSYDCTPGGGATYGHGYLDFAISDTADPTAGWTRYKYVYADSIPDYPGVGASTDKVVISANLYPFVDVGCQFGDLAGIDLAVLDWAQLETAPDPAALAISYFTSGPGLSTFRPGLQALATEATVYGVLAIGSLGGDDVGYLTVTGSAVADTVTVGPVIDLTGGGLFEPYGLPPAPRQPGPDTIATAVDGRPTDAIWQDGRLVMVATTDCVPAGDTEARACIRVSELLTSSVARRQDLLLAYAGSDLYHGGIGLSMNGALHVTYTRSSTSENPSTYGVYQLPGDPTNAVSAAELLRAGTAPYGGERWGDYTGVAQDPQDPRVVWQTNEVSNGGWLTHISPLSTAVGTTFAPITPQRVLDTRPASQVGLANKFEHGVARSWQVAGVGSIPVGAVAVTGNVTVVDQTGPGYVSVTPRPTTTPTNSAINFPLGDVRANNVTTPLGLDGTLSAVYISSAGKRTHVLFDVTGYFVAGEAGTEYNPLTPVRLVDTRPTSANRLKRDVPRSFQITGLGGVPAGAVAVTGNVTVTQQTASGVVSLTPTPDANPATSTLNFPLRDNRANGVTVPLSPAGKMSAVYKSTAAGARTHLIFDVTGYYSPGPGGLHYFPLNPGRRMDTRETVLTGLSGQFHGNTSRTLESAAHLGVPPDAAAVTGNLTVTKSTRAGYLALTPDATIDPPTSTLNFPLGDTRANGITQRLNSSGDMSIWFDTAAGGSVHAILDVTGYFR